MIQHHCFFMLTSHIHHNHILPLKTHRIILPFQRTSNRQSKRLSWMLQESQHMDDLRGDKPQLQIKYAVTTHRLIA